MKRLILLLPLLTINAFAADDVRLAFKKLIYTYSRNIQLEPDMKQRWKELDNFQVAIRKFEDEHDTQISTSLRIDIAATETFLEIIPPPSAFKKARCSKYKDDLVAQMPEQPTAEYAEFNRAVVDILSSFCQKSR